MRKVYISGKITGLNIEFARANFKKAERMLQARGYETVNPFDNGVSQDSPWEDHMCVDLENLRKCEYMYQMKNWIASRGAKCEYEEALKAGIKILRYENGDIVEMNSPISTVIYDQKNSLCNNGIELVDILTFINSIRESDRYIKTIYLNGGCFQFYVLLQIIFGGCEPLINEDENHVVTRYKGKIYDITGEIKEGRYNSMTVEQLRMCEKWSFSKSRALITGRCQYCDEPIVIDMEY